MSVISISNHKGGVGKTATAINLADSLARKQGPSGKNYRVLVVDLDPQSNLTSTLFPFEKKEYKGALTIVDMFKGERIESCITQSSSKSLDILPSNIELFDIERKIATSLKGFLGLKTAIEESEVKEKYDFIIIDSPPNLGPFMVNGFVASDYYIVPMQSGSPYSLDGITSLADRIKDISPANNKLSLLGYLITFHDGRNSTCKTMEHEIRRRFGKNVFHQVIRKNTDIDKAVAEKKTIFQKDVRKNGAKDYAGLAEEVLERIS